MSTTNYIPTNGLDAVYNQLTNLTAQVQHLKNKSDSDLLTNLTSQVTNLTRHVQNLESKYNWPSTSKELWNLAGCAFIALVVVYLLGRSDLHDWTGKMIKSWRKRAGWFEKVCHRIETGIEDPKNPFAFMRGSFAKHLPEYLVLFFIPVLIGMRTSSNLLTIIGVWGFLVTTLSAFYAQKAELSSNRAVDQARRTHDCVLQFADDLTSFVEKVKFRLGEMINSEGGLQRVQMLSVIPLFGSVGLSQYYEGQKKHDPKYQSLHLFLLEHLKNDSIRKLEVISHTGAQSLAWIANILEVEARQRIGAGKAKIEDEQKRLQGEIVSHYLRQKKFIRVLLNELGGGRIDWRLWDPAKLVRLQTQAQRYKESEIPFQFIVAESRQGRKRVFVLFSGSYLYDLVFKAVEFSKPVDMAKLVELTKGYYEDSDRLVSGPLIEIFEQVFECFKNSMVTIVPGQNGNIQDFNVAYPDKSDVPVLGTSKLVDVETPFAVFEVWLSNPNNFQKVEDLANEIDK
jgi:hypothetical protein